MGSSVTMKRGKMASGIATPTSHGFFEKREGGKVGRVGKGKGKKKRTERIPQGNKSFQPKQPREGGNENFKKKGKGKFEGTTG